MKRAEHFTPVTEAEPLSQAGDVRVEIESEQAEIETTPEITSSTAETPEPPIHPNIRPETPPLDILTFGNSPDFLLDVKPTTLELTPPPPAAPQRLPQRTGGHSSIRRLEQRVSGRRAA